MSKLQFARTSTQVCQIRYSSVLFYEKVESTGSLHRKHDLRSYLHHRYSGLVTSHVRKRIAKAVDLFLQLSPKRTLYNPVTNSRHPYQLSFITLTISNHETAISGKEGYKYLLNPFLKWLRETKKVKHFIWKAEIQKRGQLHYHITLNQFVHFKEIQEKWNYLQRKNNLLDSFYLANNHYNPNSTDVHSVRNIKNIQGYLTKYLSKPQEDSEIEAITNSKETTFLHDIYEGNIISCMPVQHFNQYNVGGKTWDCSDSLRGKKYFNCELENMANDVLTQKVSTKECRHWDNAFCKIVFGKDEYPKELLNETQLNNYFHHINNT